MVQDKPLVVGGLVVKAVGACEKVVLVKIQDEQIVVVGGYAGGRILLKRLVKAFPEKDRRSLLAQPGPVLTQPIPLLIWPGPWAIQGRSRLR